MHSEQARHLARWMAANYTLIQDPRPVPIWSRIRRWLRF